MGDIPPMARGPAMFDTRMKQKAGDEFARRHPVFVRWGWGWLVAVVVLAAVALIGSLVYGGVRWLLGRLSAPSVPHPSAPNWSVPIGPIGWTVAAALAVLVAVWAVRRVIRKARYGV